jgi:hypothetical protein
VFAEHRAAALLSDAPPRHVRQPGGSIVNEVEPRIRELLIACPTMPATVIAERISWTRSIRARRGGAAAPDVSAAGPGRAHQLCGRGDRPARFLVPISSLPVGFGQRRTATQLPVLTMVCG